MPKEGYNVFTIKEEIVERAKIVYGKKLKRASSWKQRDDLGSLSGFLGALILAGVEREEIFLENPPSLEKLPYSIGDPSILIRDRKLGRIVEVKLLNGKVHCCHDDSTECVHVGFAQAFPDLFRARDGERNI